MTAHMVKIIAKIAAWLGPKRDARLLQAIAFVRSAGQAMALVDVSLYLKELGWSGGAIGAVLAGAGLTRTLAALFAREGRNLLGSKRFLLLFELLTAVAAATAAAASSPAVLSVALIAAGLGAGHSGSGGPSAPIERAWLAAYSRQGSQRLFHVNALLGYLGMGVGAWLGCLPSWNVGGLQGTAGFRLLFALIAAAAAANALLTLRLQGGRRKPAPPQRTAATESSPAAVHAARPGPKMLALAAVCLASLALSAVLRRHGLNQLSLFVPIAAFIGLVGAGAARLLVRVRADGPGGHAAEDLKHLSNVLSGVVVTLTGTTTSYWFASRFGASPGAIGAVMGASYIAAALLSLAGADKPRRGDRVRSVLLMQTAAIALLLVQPWTTSLWLAACLEIGSTALNLGTRGTRNAIMMEEPRGERSGFARFSYLIIRIGAVLWPGAFDRFIESGQYAVPFGIAAGLQAASAALYARVFCRSPAPTGIKPEA